MTISPDYISFLYSEAMKEAEKAFEADEVPIGAVLATPEKIISRAHNQVEMDKDATAHAEVLAIRRAAIEIGNWRLNDLILCVTMEPCTMCAGAVKQSRVGTVIYGLADERAGAFGSIYDLTNQDPVTRVIKFDDKHASHQILKSFFSKKR